MKTVYLDHAATSWPKPKEVVRAAAQAVRNAGGNPGRGSHPLANAAGELLYTARAEAASFFEADPFRTVFTPGATYSLNMAVRGLAKKGCHILYDNFAHNALLRPIRALTDSGFCTADSVDALSDEGLMTDLNAKLKPETRVVAVTHQSNICSRVLPLRKIGDFCRTHGLIFIVDAAQSTGRLPLSVEGEGISALCVPGHKGLCGYPGVGLLLLSRDSACDPLIFGGTGIRSEEPGMPEELPERLEPGTLPLPAIAALAQGIRLVRRTGLSAIERRERELSRRFTAGLKRLNSFRTAGPADGSVVSILHESRTPAEIGNMLALHGICVRTGLHCAPLAHATLGTGGSGTVRISFSRGNTEKDVERILNVLEDID